VTVSATGVYELPQHYLDLRELVRRIAQEQVGPRAAQIDASDEYPWDQRRLLAEHDILALPFAEEHGGTGTGTLMLQIAVEELARASAAVALILIVQELGTLPLRLFGNDEQKQRFLPRCASGEWSPAFCLSEAEAGSDPASMQCSARRDGDEWVIDGTKSWITNAGIADFYVVFAVTDRDQRRSTAFVVESERPGLSVPKFEHKLGIHGSTTGTPVFDGVRVPDRNRIGDVGKGLAIALATLERSRLGVAAQAVGIAQGATDYATDYAKQRLAFGKPIIDLQAIQFKLADMQTSTAAARELLYKACVLADSGDAQAPMYSSMAKLFASDTAMAVTVEAVQVLGAYGYTGEYPVERMMRDAKVTQIYEGTNEIQRLVVARQMRGRG
jgi:alkylation response protein AidB-like acyl-CoA dehydrogenase